MTECTVDLRWVSSGTLLEMQTLGPHLDLLDQNPLFNKLEVKFENYFSSVFPSPDLRPAPPTGQIAR